MYKNARETDRKIEREEAAGESFIVRKQYEGKSLIKTQKLFYLFKTQQ